MGFSKTLRHVNNRTGLIVMVAIFCPIMIIVVIFRFYARYLTKVGLGADDWLALASLIFVLALNGIFLGGTIQGPITGHSPVVNNWPVTTDLEILAQKYKYAFQITEKIVFGLVKLSLLFLWKRLFARSKSFGLLCWVMIGILTAWMLAFLFATVFQCGTRWAMNWAAIGIFLSQCIDSLNVLTVFTITDIATDFIIMFMPVPLIWRLHMPTKKKIGVTSIFMVGLFTIGAGVARSFMYLVTSYDKESNPDFIADFTLCILWSEIEANVAMIVCCMPTLAPVIGKFRDDITSLQRTTCSKWTPLSFERTASNGHSKDRELSTLSRDQNLHQGNPFHNQPPWRGGPGIVTTAGYNDTEEQLGHSQGILARTEISTVVEDIHDGP